MRWVVRIFSVLLLIATVVVAIIFLTANETPYQLGFLEWKTFESTIGVFVLLAFVFGSLIGFLCGMPVILGMRLQLRKMQKKLNAQLSEADA